MKKYLIYLAYPFILALLLSWFEDSLTYLDCIFVVALFRFLFGILGILDNKGNYDSVKYQMYIFRKRIIGRETPMEFLDYIKAKKALNSPYTKLLINALYMLTVIFIQVLF